MSDHLALIDSNVLIYADLDNSPFNQAAQDFINKGIASAGDFAIAIQNLVEFYSVLTNPKQTNPVRSASEASQKIRKIIESGFYKIVIPKVQTSGTILRLLAKYPVRGADIHDLNLAATMIDNNIDTIYTADTKIFKKLGLKTINPLT